MIRGAECACQGLLKARVKRKRIAQKPGEADRFAIRAGFRRFSRMDLSRSAVLCRENFFT